MKKVKSWAYWLEYLPGRRTYLGSVDISEAHLFIWLNDWYIYMYTYISINTDMLSWLRIHIPAHPSGRWWILHETGGNQICLSHFLTKYSNYSTVTWKRILLFSSQTRWWLVQCCKTSVCLWLCRIQPNFQAAAKKRYLEL